jgi:hypothetical protein
MWDARQWSPDFGFLAAGFLMGFCPVICTPTSGEQASLSEIGISIRQRMVADKTDPQSDEAARYGHFSLNELRDARESIGAGIEAGVPGIFLGIGWKRGSEAP